VLSTSGPGATNLVTGLATAMMDLVPMAAVTGQVASGLIGTDAFQEVDVTGVTLPVTKHNYVVDPEAAVYPLVPPGGRLEDKMHEPGLPAPTPR